MQLELKQKHVNALLKWYEKEKRDLPWRHTNDPYRIWISEIMLQQTRVEAVIEKYNAFIQRLPDIKALATVEDDTLLKLWEGLGYYSRARNLKKSAQIIVQEYNGIFPSEEKILLSLPGIGPYTAGAILSIAFHQPKVAIDGNVMRILARLFEIKDDIRLPKTKQYFETCLQEYYKKHPKAQPHLLNQAFMELGALVCLPNGSPNCVNCPWRKDCLSHQNNTYLQIPYRSSLKQRKIENRTILIIRDGNHFLLHKRSEKGLLSGLYEFLGVSSHLSKAEVLDYVNQLGFEPLRIKLLPSSKHIFSHIEWHMKAYEIQVSNLNHLKDTGYSFVTKKELQSYAIPSAFQAYLSYYQLKD